LAQAHVVALHTATSHLRVYDRALPAAHAGLARLPATRERPGEDDAAQLRLRHPGREVPLRAGGPRFSAAAAPPLRHQGASSFFFTVSKSSPNSALMCVPRTRSFAGNTSGLWGTATPESRRPWRAANSRPPGEGLCPPMSRIASFRPCAEARRPAR